MRWMVGGLLALQALGAMAEGISDAERAKRDAEKVFSFIKIQTVRKADAAPAAKAEAPKPAVARAPAPAATTATATARPSEPEPAQTEPARLRADLSPAAAPQTQSVDALPVVAMANTRSLAPTAPSAAPAPEDDESELKLIDFVAPELSTQLQATLGTSNPRVKLHFKVGADGRVVSVRAAEGVPRRIGQVAERAVAQWRFEAISAPREAEVEIAFRRD